jgi:hypothetical protein
MVVIPAPTVILTPTVILAQARSQGVQYRPRD